MAADPPAPSRKDWLFVAVACQLAVALIAGGTARPANVLVCFLAAVPLLGLLLAGTRSEPLAWPARLALALYGLAWLQLVPLPPSVWTALPGRALAADVLLAAGMQPGWRPLALDPGAAAAALASLAAPLVLLVAAARLDADERRILLQGIVGTALVMAMLGVVQRITGTLAPYDIDHAGYATGLFANRNHLAAFLASALLLLPALRKNDRDRRASPVLAAASLLLFAGILATTSRAGIALGLVALLVSQFLWWRPSGRAALAGGVVLALAAALLLQVPALAPVFDRFAALAQDDRFVMAETTLAAARAYFPWGSGWGSFVPVYMTFEDLDTLGGNFVVAAHNDYLQLVMEGGWLGLAVAMAGPLALVALAAGKLQTRSGTASWSLWWICAVLLAHSAVDYPLRTDALSAFLALAFAMQDNRRKPLPPGGGAD